jgi:hypothetical protein
VLPLAEVVEVDAALVGHLANQLVGLHVVVGVLEDVLHDAAPVGTPIETSNLTKSLLTGMAGRVRRRRLRTSLGRDPCPGG